MIKDSNKNRCCNILGKSKIYLLLMGLWCMIPLTTQAQSDTLTTQAEVDNFESTLGGSTVVTGNLIITSFRGGITHLDSLYFLTEIRGNWMIQNNSNLDSIVGFDSLTKVGNNLEIKENSSLTHISLPALDTVGGNFHIQDNKRLDTLGDYRSLRHIGGYFKIFSFNNSRLVDLGNFSMLENIGGYFELSQNENLANGGNFPMLDRIGGYFSVNDNKILRSLYDFPALTSIGVGNDVYIPSLDERRDSVSIVVDSNPLLEYCCVLTKIREGGLTISDDVFISNNFEGCNSTEMSSCNLSVRLSAGDTLLLPYNSIDTTFTLYSNTRWQLSKLNPMDADWASLSSGGVSNSDSLISERDARIMVNYSPNISGESRMVRLLISFLDTMDVVTPADTLTLIQESAVPILEFQSPSAVNVGYERGSVGLTFRSNTRWRLRKSDPSVNWITMLSDGTTNVMDSLEGGRIGDFTTFNDTTVTITYERAPTSSSRSAELTLVTIGNDDDELPLPVNITITQSGIPPVYVGSITLTTQAEVNRIRTTLGGATVITGALLIASPFSEITHLDSLYFLTEIGNNLSFQGNSILESIVGFDSLTNIGGGLFILENPSLRKVHAFSALRKIGGGYQHLNNANLEVITGLPVLDTILGGFSILGGALARGHTSLDSLGDYSSLRHIGGSFRLGFNSFDPVFLGDFSMLETIGGRFQIHDNTRLRDTPQFPRLTSIDKSISINNNDSLRYLYEFPALTSIGVGNNVYIPRLNEFRDNVSIVVEDNPLLEYCCALTRFREGGGIILGRTYVNNNFEGCKSIEMSSCNLSVRLSVDDTVRLPFFSEETVFTLYSNARWQLSKLNPGDADWVTSLSSGGVNNSDSLTLNRDARIRVNYTPNTNSESRTVQLLISFLDESGVATPADTLTLIQEGTMPTFEFQSSSAVNVGYERDSVELAFRFNTRWRLRKSDTSVNWIRMFSVGTTNVMGSLEGGRIGDFTTFNDTTVTITYESAPTSSSRSATLILVAIDNNGNELPLPVNITITQSGIPAYTESVTLKNQAQVDTIRNTLGRATAIEGNLIIGSSTDITHLDSLYFLTEITGNLEIRNNSILENVGEFPALNSIGGYFLMHSNTILRNAGDFPVLKHIGKYFLIRASDSLTSIGSFPRLTTIGESFSVRGTKILRVLYDFPALTNIGTGRAYVPSVKRTRSNTSIVVEDNSQLEYCCVLTRLRGGIISGRTYVNNNFEGCNSIEMSSCNLSVRLSVDDTVRFPFFSEETVFTLYSNARWRLSKLNPGDADWVTSLSSGVGEGVANNLVGARDTRIRVNHTPNPNSESRMVQLFISFLDEMDVATPADTLTLIQEGTVPVLKFQPSSAVNVGYERDSVRLTFRFNTKWRLRKSDPSVDWITMLSDGTTNVMDSLEGGMGGDLTTFKDTTVTITYEGAPISVSRSATLTLVAIDNEDDELPLSTAITIIQEGYPYYGENITLINQAQVDTIRNTLGRSTAIRGNLIIGPSSDITDLSPLSFLTEVTGNFMIGTFNNGNAGLDSIADFSSLGSIGGNLDIRNNSSLTYTGNFPALKSIGGRYLLGNNDALLVAEGFPMLDTLSEIFIINNRKLERLGEYNSLRHIKTNYIIGDGYRAGRFNPSLVDLGSFPQLRTIGNHYQVFNSDSLVSIADNFPFLERIGGNFEIAGNEKLETIDFSSSLQFVGGNFIIGETHFGNNNDISPNPSLVSLDFSSLAEVGRYFLIRDNDRLTNLGSFPGLTRIGSYFSVIDNDGLRSLYDFPSLTSIGRGSAQVPSANRTISNTSIVIDSNPLLEYCCVLTKLREGGLTISGDSTYISNNFEGCNISDDEDETNCNLSVRLSVDDTVRFPFFSEETVFTFYSNTRWRLSKLNPGDANWVTSLSSGVGEGVTNNLVGARDARIKVNYTPNTNRESRTVRLLISFLDTMGNVLTSPVPDTLTLIQGLKESTLQSSSAVNVSHVLGRTEINILSNVRWRLRKSEEVDWLTILSSGTTHVTDSLEGDQSSVTLPEVSVVTLMHEAVFTSSSRSSDLILSAIDSNGTELSIPPSITITVTQLGIPPPHTNDVRLRNQAEVDDIRTTLGRATAIDANLIIESSTDITNLNSLYFLTEITGNFFIGNTNKGNTELVDIGDFPFLQKIGGNYYVTENPELVNGGNFPVLDSIGGYFFIRSHGKLTSVGSYPNLRAIGGYLSIRSNDSLRSLYDFPSLTSIGHDSAWVPSSKAGGGFVDSVSIVVEDNSQLEYCCTLTRIRAGGGITISGSTYISNNFEGCNISDDGDETNCDLSVRLSVEKTLLLPYTSIDTTFTAYSNAQWRLSKLNPGDAGWITSLSSGGEPNSDSLILDRDATITLTYSQNLSDVSRTAKFLVSFLDTMGNVLTSPVPDTLTLIQEDQRPKIRFISSNENINIPYHSVEPINITFAIGGTATDWTRSEITYTPDGNEDFIEITSETPAQMGIVMIGLTPTVNTGAERMAVFTLSPGPLAGSGDNVNITITQAGAPPPKLSITTPSGDTSVAYTATTTSDSVEIAFTVGNATSWESMISYGVGEDTFVTLTGNPLDTGEVRIKVAVTKNDSVERSAKIVFSTTGQGNFSPAKDSLTITQGGAPPMFMLTSGRAETIAYDTTSASDITFTVGGGAASWTADVIDGDSDNNFLMLDKTSGSAGLDTIKVTTTENTGGARMDTIVIMTMGGTGEATDTIIVTQGATPTTPPVDPPTLVIITNDTTINHNDTVAFEITFTLGGTAMGWTSTLGGEDFITLDPEQDTTATGKVTITATPSTNTGVERTDTIILMTTGDADMVIITQRAASSTPAAPTISIFTTDTTIEATDTSAISVMFEVGGNAMGWGSTITYMPANANFITLSPIGRADQTGAITIMATPTGINTGVERSAKIVFSTTGQGNFSPAKDSLTITQGGAPPMFMLTSGRAETIAYDTTSASDITFTVGGGAASWTADVIDGDSDNNFLMLDKTSGSAGLDTIKVTTTENTGGARMDTIVIMTMGGTGEATDTIIVTQGATPTTPPVDPPTLVIITNDTTINHNDTVAFEITFTLGGTAMGWTSTLGGEDFITLDPEQDTTATGKVTITATPSTNTGVERTDTIILMTTGDADMVIITQRAASSTPAAPTISIFTTDTTIEATDTSAISVMFEVGGNATGWGSTITYMPANANFITLSPIGRADQTGAITIMATPTGINTGVERSAKIVFSTTGQGNFSPAKDSLTITQGGAPPMFMLTSGRAETIAYDTTSASDITFTVGGGAASWTADVIDGDSDNNFLMLDKTSGSAGLDTIKVTTTENTGGARMDTIVIMTMGGTGEATDTIIVTQGATPTTPPVDPPTLVIITNDTTINHNDTVAFEITFTLGGTAMGWTSTLGGEDFITLDPEQDTTATGKVTITATPSTNTGVERTDTIILMTTGDADMVIITQRAASSTPAAPTISIFTTDTTIEATDTSAISVMFEVGGNATGWGSTVTYMPANANFITLSPTGRADQTGAITIMATPTGINTGVERSAKIVFSTTGQGNFSSAKDSLTITQGGAPPMFMLTSGRAETIAYDTTSASDITFTVGGGAASWTADVIDGDSDNNFLMLDKTSGSAGLDTIKVTTTENTGGARMDTIVIMTMGGTGEATDTIIVTQGATPTTPPVDPPTLVIITNDTTINHNDTVAFEITFTLGGTAMGWTSTLGGEDFITLDPEQDTTATGKVTITATPSTNTGVERTDTIILMTTGDADMVIITQRAASSTPAAPTVSIFTTDTTIEATDTSAISVMFEVGGNATGWGSTVTYMPANANFITLSPTGRADQTGAITIMATPTGINTGVERSAKIVFSTTGQGNFSSAKDSLTITQGGAPPMFMLTSGRAETIAYDTTSASDITFTVGGGAASWTADVIDGDSDNNFLMLDKTSGSAGLDTIKVTTTENTGGARMDTIVIMTMGGTGEATDTIIVTQGTTPTTPPVDPPTLVITTNDTTINHNDTVAFEITFTLGGTAMGWTSTLGGEDFITLDPEQDTTATGKVTITATPSTNTGVERTDTIILMTTGDADTVIITQRAASSTPAAPTISIFTTDTTIEATDTSAISVMFEVGGNATGWGSTVTGGFITLDTGMNADQTGEITITATPTANTGTERVAQIVIGTTGPGDVVTDTLKITQKAGEEPKSTPAEPMISIFTTDTTIEATDTSAISVMFEVRGNATGWTSTVTGGFVTLDTGMNADQTGEITITATPTANTGAERVAQIVISTTGPGDAVTDTLKITQKAGEEPKLGISLEESLILYPNPMEGTLTIEGISEDLQIYLYDLVGKEVFTSLLSPSKTTIDLSHLPSGMYMVTLENDKKRVTELLIKK